MEPSDARVSHELPTGSIVIERYVHEKGVQWLAEVVGEDGSLYLMRACSSRREALRIADKHGTAAVRNAR